MANDKDVSRRIVLSSGLIGLGTLAVGVAGCGNAPDPSGAGETSATSASLRGGVQGGWRFCWKCACLFNGGSGGGTCQAGGGHDASQSGPYVLNFNNTTIPNTDFGFFECMQCAELYTVTRIYPLQPCPAGSQHDSGTKNYVLYTSSGPYLQGGWDICADCGAFFYVNAPEQHCPDIGRHTPSNKGLFIDLIG